ncbi:DALR anticodon-binding domain-containing protein 3 [Anopheles maculipalpis]|uniref:DALR anticodon-binding domain-containing protein 3 n=1 Tax=Anopheles maculipalpis TaxID=1496333 RepID=UPI002158BE40|nr:DALR anticodon-binding domain-containing protein 3 [Anopheles maculipalpis]
MEGILSKTQQLLYNYLENLGHSITIKMLDKNLCQMGDMLVKSKTDSELLLDEQALIAASKLWPLPISAIASCGNSANIWLDRTTAFRTALSLKEWNGSNRSMNGAKVYVEQPTVNEYNTISMTEFRANILRSTIKKCFLYGGYSLIEKTDLLDNDVPSDVMHVKVVYQRSKPSPESQMEVLCGVVLTGSETQNAAQYIQLRANDMHLTALHRYGLRMPDTSKLWELVSSLGRSAAIVDMLQSKHTNVIDMRTQRELMRNHCTSKGASFILYNYARLATILRKHAKLVQNGQALDIPPVYEIDFSLLTEPEEWQLLYAYLLRFPDTVRLTTGYGKSPQIAPYHMLNFTLCMIKCLSKYYRRVRILTDARPKLQPIMSARLCLISAVFDMLKVILDIFDMEPVEEM